MVFRKITWSRIQATVNPMSSRTETKKSDIPHDLTAQNVQLDATVVFLRANTCHVTEISFHFKLKSEEKKQ